jgi:hypothetical protein
VLFPGLPLVLSRGEALIEAGETDTNLVILFYNFFYYWKPENCNYRNYGNTGHLKKKFKPPLGIIVTCCISSSVLYVYLFVLQC